MKLKAKYCANCLTSHSHRKPLFTRFSRCLVYETGQKDDVLYLKNSPSFWCFEDSGVILIKWIWYHLIFSHSLTSWRQFLVVIVFVVAVSVKWDMLISARASRNFSMTIIKMLCALFSAYSQVAHIPEQQFHLMVRILLKKDIKKFLCSTSSVSRLQLGIKHGLMYC